MGAAALALWTSLDSVVRIDGYRRLASLALRRIPYQSHRALVVYWATYIQRLMELALLCMAPWRAGIFRYPVSLDPYRCDPGVFLARTPSIWRSPRSIFAMGQLRICTQLFYLAAQPPNSRLMLLRYLLAWLGLAILAIANGTIREYTYGKVVSELAAHQISTLTAILLSGIFVWFLHRHWPLQSTGQAWKIGIMWLVLTIAFEFGFGHWVVGHPWSRLLADYNILAGRVWGLFLAGVLVLPYAIYTLSQRTT